MGLCRLERRVFADLAGGGRAGEYTHVAAELRRLSAGCSPAIAGRAIELLDLVEAVGLLLAPDLAPPEPPEFANPEPPWPLRIGLGRFIAARTPIPIPWAFAWHTNHPDRRWRAPATRCREEFASLFWMRYRQAYQGGLLVNWSNSVPELSFTYRLVSPGLGGRRVTVHTGLPDVRRCEPELAALHVLAEGVQAELEEYARFLARNPQARGTDDAFALLPAGLARPAAPDLRRVTEWCVARLIENTVAIVPGAPLLELLPPQAGRVGPVGGLLLAYALDRRGIGIEPDPRAFGRELRTTDEVALFRRGAERPPRDSAALAAGTVLLHLSAAIGVREELPLLCEHLCAGGLDLVDDERYRLEARTHLLQHRRPDLGPLRRRLDALPRPTQGGAADVLVAALGADGQLSHAEIELLGDLYALLGLADPDLRARLSVLGEPGPEPVPGSVAIDRDLAAHLLAESGPVALALAAACAEAGAAAPVPAAA